ncbi:hypothetical protein GYMLUDRAFT_758125 [Collybiopsis luxurians FD-317 M1]|uniref:DUF6697 domain-containing protein n=1 Tax=Collybiopsis luxurians FD-317 M1 TaxID=944289 RepID=A0A0D0B2M1_9AGAR|nr:hypothetical protein GYMLUDRAFT_758125 [Collybiopsis luxurians FD-317 M1]
MSLDEGDQEDVEPAARRKRGRVSTTAKHPKHDLDIKPKIKEEMLVDTATVDSRLAIAQCVTFNVTLELTLRNVHVSRRFISQTYGGSEVSAFPTIKQENLDKHGRENWMFWSVLESQACGTRRALLLIRRRTIFLAMDLRI